MAHEDDNNNLDNNNNQGDNNRQIDPRDTSSQLDKQLNDFINETGDDRGRQSDQGNRSERTDQTSDQITRQTEQGQGQGRDQNRQADTSRQSDDGTFRDRSIPQPPRQYGSFFRATEQGDIVDANGARIARSGGERRAFERIFNSYRPVEQELATLRDRIRTIDETNVAARNAGLTPEESAIGQRLAIAWKRDKKGTISFLLNQAGQAGIDMSDLVQGGAGLTIDQVKTTLAEMLQPFQQFVDRSRQSDEEQQLQRDASDRAISELNEFYEDAPNARFHAAHIATIMDRTGGTLRESWLQLQLAATRNGWNLDQDLAPQAQATMRRNPTGGGNNQQLPPMGGRGNINGAIGANRRTLANTDDSWDSIINGAVEEVTGQSFQ